jgi:hypothetical protein
MSDLRPLMMRANRALGSSLVEHNLISVEDLDAANERLLELASSEQVVENPSLLQILIHEKSALTEEHLLTYQVEEMGLGLIDLTNYEQPYDLRKTIDTDVCLATWTVPLDTEEGINLLATAYYLSPAVKNHWERQITTPIIWYVTSMENISDFIRKLLVEREAEAARNK